MGFAPIAPHPDTRRVMSAYEVAVDSDTGIALEYRRWGNADSDDAREVIECNYGYAKGEAAALKRICRR